VSSNDESLSLCIGDISLSCDCKGFPLRIDVWIIGFGWRSDGWCGRILQPKIEIINKNYFCAFIYH
jgi:hypothetical protein